MLLQLAYPHEDFKNFGATNNGKIAARYTVNKKLTLRGALSTGFHAPTAGIANVTTTTTNFDTEKGTQIQEGTVRPTDPLAIKLGGKALVPETSVNLSLGLASRFSNSLSFTLDYYHIDIDKRIIKSRNLPIIGDPNFTELAFYSNALNTETRGTDVVVIWRNDVININFAYSYNITSVLSQEQVNGVNPVSDRSIFNIENSVPKNRINVTLNRNFGKLTAMVRANYYGTAFDQEESHEEIGSEVLVDLEINYQAMEKLILIMGANNVFDNYPDEISAWRTQGMPTRFGHRLDIMEGWSISEQYTTTKQNLTAIYVNCLFEQKNMFMRRSWIPNSSSLWSKRKMTKKSKLLKSLRRRRIIPKSPTPNLLLAVRLTSNLFRQP